MKKTNTILLNGRTLGDLSGSYTCSHYNGKSTVDYGIVNESMFSQCNYFCVSNLDNPISDHANISMAFQIIQKSKSKGTSPGITIEAVPGYRWESDSELKFTEQLCKPTHAGKVAEFMRKKYLSNEKDTNECCDNFTHLVLDIADSCLMRKPKRPPKKLSILKRHKS